MTSILSPTKVLRGRWPEALAQVMTLRRAAAVSQKLPGWEDFFVDPSVAPPGTTLWPTVKKLQGWRRHVAKFESVAIDIEAVGQYITIIGFTLFNQISVGPTVVVPFKTRGGLDYWTSWEDHLAATKFCYELLDDERTEKWFHNGVTFDVPMLQEAGFSVRGPLWDTMNLAHYTYPEMKKGLQYLSTAYLGMPNWKGMLDVKDDNEAKS